LDYSFEHMQYANIGLSDGTVPPAGFSPSMLGQCAGQSIKRAHAITVESISNQTGEAST